MKIKTLWLLILKSFGLWMVYLSFSVVPTSILPLTFVMGSVNPMIVIPFGLLVCYGLLIWLTLFKTSWLIDVLRLAKDFDEEQINISINAQTFLSVVLIISAVIILIDAVPTLCKFIVLALVRSTFGSPVSAVDFIITLAKTILALVFIYKNKQLAKLLLDKASE